MQKIIVCLSILVAVIFIVGFRTDNAIVPREQILSGGPPKDGIPAILQPRFVKPGSAEFIAEDDQVIGVVIGGAARAYPIKILNWHEVVNDKIGEEPIMISF